MATKEKTDVTPEKEKEFNADSVKTQLEEKVEYGKKLVAERERLLKEGSKLQNMLNQVDLAINQNDGYINAYQGIQKEYFQGTPSVNGQG